MPIKVLIKVLINVLKFIKQYGHEKVIFNTILWL
jgi:hypothetical protein